MLRETLRPGTEFWTGEKTLRFLAETDYFKEEGEEAGPVHWPQMLLQMTKDGQYRRTGGGKLSEIFVTLYRSVDGCSAPLSRMAILIGMA